MKKRIFCAICCVFMLAAITITTYSAAIDWTNYTSSNLLPLPYTSGEPGSSLTTNGVTRTVNEDGSITFSGTSTADVYFWLAEMPLENGQYNYHSEITGTYTGLWVGWDTNNGSVYDGEGTFYASYSTPYRFFLALQPNRTYSFTIKIMLNKTATAYPYQPYIPYYIKQAENAVANPFKNAKFYAQLESGNDVYVKEFTPTYFTNGVSLKPLYNYIMNSEYYMINWLSIVWQDTNTWDYASFPVYITSPASQINGILYNQNNEANQLIISDEIQLARPLTLNPNYEIHYPLNVKEIRFEPIGTVSDIEVTTISVNIEVYNQGYANGYNDGIKANNQNVYNEGKADGYKNGFIEGKAEGLALSQTGDWRSLISAVIEAPVNTFQSLFSFEILGMDMQKAIGAILALCVILIIIKKVVL